MKAISIGIMCLLLLSSVLIYNTNESTMVETNDIISPGERFAPGRDWKIYTSVGAFDPLNEILDVPFKLQNSNGFYIIQVNRMRDGTEKDILINNGVTIFNEINNMGWIVHMNDSVKSNIQSLDFIRWIGNYEPSYKLPVITEQKPIKIMVNFFDGNLLRGYEGKYNRITEPFARNIVGNIGGIIDDVKSDYNLSSFLVVNTHTSLLPIFAYVKEIKYISIIEEPELCLSEVRGYSGVDALTAIPIAGNELSVVREGPASIKPRDSHDEFEAQYGNTSQLVGVSGSTIDWHMTHTTGIWTAWGDSSSARGIAPVGQVHPMSWDDSDATVASYLDSVGGRFVSDSWSYGSSGANGKYGTESSLRDVEMWNYGEFASDGEGLMFVSSASNYGGTGTGIEGDDNSVANTATHKNGLSAGGLADHASTNRATHDWCDYIEMSTSEGASCGFTDDDRHKPDLWGMAEFDVYSVDDDSNSDYGDFGGTSAAAPIIGATSSIARQAYEAGKVSRALDPTPTDVHMSTVKAMLYASSYQSELGVKATRKSMGYGQIDLGFAMDVNNPMLILNDADSAVRGGASDTFIVSPISGYDLRISLVWTDTPGIAGTSGKTLNNDLDLEVTSVSTSDYWLGNRGLFNLASSPWGDEYSDSYNGGVKSNFWTSTPGDADHANNDEAVFIDNPSGNYKIIVRGYDTPTGSIPYSLVVYGGRLEKAEKIQPGWHTFSIQENVSNESLETVLYSFFGKSNNIQSFDNINKTWEHYTYPELFNNTLLKMNNTRAFYINVTELAIIHVDGTIQETDVPLYVGWNFVGYPSEYAWTVEASMQGVSYSKIEYYDKYTETVYDLEPLDFMFPKQGYWIYCTTNQTWTV